MWGTGKLVLVSLAHAHARDSSAGRVKRHNIQGAIWSFSLLYPTCQASSNGTWMEGYGGKKNWREDCATEFLKGMKFKRNFHRGIQVKDSKTQWYSVLRSSSPRVFLSLPGSHGRSSPLPPPARVRPEFLPSRARPRAPALPRINPVWRGHHLRRQRGLRQVQ